ncbi:hypothetical protein W823_19070 [Williamsia sp. D3]|nr:hypothetical protein W823_19070 [Williamsia sp. D3]
MPAVSFPVAIDVTPQLSRRLVLNPWQSRHVREMLSLCDTSVELPA